jgi:hypothetical protein
MGAIAIIDLIEMLFGIASTTAEELKNYGVLPGTHPVHQKVSELSQKIADAKAAAAAQPSP